MASADARVQSADRGCTPQNPLVPATRYGAVTRVIRRDS